MVNRSQIAKSVKLALMYGAATASLVASTATYSQETENEEEAVEKIAVTGSRIARLELSTPAPIITLDAKQIERFGTPDLGSILAEIPAISAGSTLIGNNGNNANAGISSPDLRGLGEDRTLTLVNGIRHVAGSPGTSAVDTGSIPTTLIDRVEVITGGASAIYGSDAVSGVINIILRDDYEGLEFNVSGTTDTESVGADNHRFSVLAGASSSDGRGNVTFFAELNRIAEVLEPELQQAQAFGTIINPENLAGLTQQPDGTFLDANGNVVDPENNGIPDLLRVPFVGSEFINNFGVLNPFGGGPRITFAPDGTPIDQVSRLENNSFAFGNFTERFDTVFFGEDFRNYIPEQNTLTLNSTFKYDITDNIRFYGEAKYVDKDIEQQFQPSFRFGGISINVEDNPFLDEATRQRLLDGGQSVVTLSRFFGDIGNRSASNDRELFRFVGGFKGGFSLGKTDFDYDVYYTYGETSTTRFTLNDLIPSNLNAALDAVIDPETGEVACRSQVPSAQGEGFEDPAEVNGDQCVAFNPFGFNQASPEAQAFVSGDVRREDTISQEIYGGTLGFDTSAFFELPGGAIGISLGYEYREEESETLTDEFTQAGFFTNAPTPNAFGAFDVEEFFVEVSLPILADVPVFHELTLDGAYRTADYSHAGNADAWQVGLVWAPIEGLRLRGTISEAVRAPNLNEAFSPQSPGFANIGDPCDNDRIFDDPDRAANCAALGIPVGFEANDNVSIQTISGGNPDLFSETADSKTFGVVWTPNFIENFSMTVDFFDIEISDAIDLVSAQNVLDNCVDATGGPDVNFCGQIDRDPDTLDITTVRSGFINSAAFTTQGIESNVRYRSELGAIGLPGEARFNLSVTKLLELNEFAFQTRPDEINVEDGEDGDPDLQFSTSVDYLVGDWSFNWSSRFIDRSALFDVSPNGGSPEDVDIAFVGSVWTHDFSVDYNLSDSVRIYGTLSNAFNKVPPGFILNRGGDALYDLVGRSVSVGVRVSFE